MSGNSLITKTEPLSGTERVLALDWVPLGRAGLCLDCEAVFVISRDGCPACASSNFMPLATWLRQRQRTS